MNKAKIQNIFSRRRRKTKEGNKTLLGLVPGRVVPGRGPLLRLGRSLGHFLVFSQYRATESVTGETHSSWPAFPLALVPGPGHPARHCTGKRPVSIRCTGCTACCCRPSRPGRTICRDCSGGRGPWGWAPPAPNCSFSRTVSSRSNYWSQFANQ